MKCALAFAIGVASAMPAIAQDPDAAQPSPDPSEEPVTIDLLTLPPPSQVDAITDEQCERDQDAARIAGQIIVCRRLNDGAEFSGFDKQDWERRYAERTQGPKNPNVEGAGGSIIMPSEGSLATITVTAKFGDAPPPALIIDIEALPEAPPGSDADRVARGLPPTASD